MDDITVHKIKNQGPRQHHPASSSDAMPHLTKAFAGPESRIIEILLTQRVCYDVSLYVC